MSNDVMGVTYGQLNGNPPAVRDNTFRPGEGGQLRPDWADYMLYLWWSAQDKKLTFAEAVKAAAVHFLVDSGE